jgi:hypothetical protein
MSLSDALILSVVFAVVQAIAFFSSRSVLGTEAGWKINNLLGLSCLVTIWGPAYAGLFAQSVWLWLFLFGCGVTLVVYGLRRRAFFQISVKQALLIYWGVAIRLIGAALALGAVARGLMFLIKNVASTSAPV